MASWRVSAAGRVQAIVACSVLLIFVLVAYHGPLFSYINSLVAGTISTKWRNFGGLKSVDVTILPEVDGASGAVRLTKRSRSSKVTEISSEVSSEVFTQICKDRLAQLNSIKGLSMRCRKVLLGYIKNREKERQMQISKNSTHDLLHI
mmetsp:Transcript_15133/g.20885  ORF Transcript_15133/g.20885 Transcript_15133/m.20885 type:complete len:148 (+) Transcript_15133:243-686(+)